ncbi:MAG: DUF4411 family protein [Actinomycetota bacterium]
MAYLLDANVFISAKNAYYAFDLCPAFWEWLERAHGRGSVLSVDAVYNELVGLRDELTEWARGHRAMFIPPSPADLPFVARVNRWAIDSSDYDAAAKAEFASKADSFLVAQAMAGVHTVVTHERVSDGRKTIKIPNAAIANGVTVVNPFVMLRSEGARFVLP